MIPGADVMKEFEVGILCPIQGLDKLRTNPSLDKSGQKPKIVSGRNREISITIKLTQGSYVIYTIDKADGKSEMRNHSTELEPKEVTFKLTYSVIGKYLVNITARNLISEERYEFEADINNCPPEELEITGSPEEGNPTMITRGMEYKVTGTVTKPNCTGSQDPVSYSIEFHSIDNSRVLERKNATNDTLRYTVAKLSRDAGMYKIVFTQEIRTSDGLQRNIKTAYLLIKQTPLLAMIDSGSSRQLPLRKISSKGKAPQFYLVELDGSLSYDPDNKSSPLTYEWLCRASNLTLVTNRTYECNHTEFRPYQKSLWQAKMTVNTSGFVVNTTYEFLLKISDKSKSRTSNYTQKIYFVRSGPPAVQFQ